MAEPLQMPTPSSPYSPRLKRAFLSAPVTALAFLTSSTTGRLLLIAGEDNNAAIYDAVTGHLCARFRVFASQSIHGIACSASHPDPIGAPAVVLFWGSRAVVALPVAAIEAHAATGTLNWDADGLLAHAHESQAPDWIYAGAMSPYDLHSGALVNAHNELVLIRVADRPADSETGPCATLSFGAVASPSRPILYSATLAWLAPEVVLVVGGTVFGEILVWKCHLSRQAVVSTEVLAVLTGHEGSIFGVDILSGIAGPNGTPYSLLASCSDDRTIRVWDITEYHDVQAAKRDPVLLDHSARETGFGTSIEAQAATSQGDNGDKTLSTSETNITAGHPEPNSRTPLLATVMAHSSRIWAVKFPGPQSSNSLDLYSFGEDTTVQRWHVNLSTVSQPDFTHQLAAVLAHQETKSIHDGKHIWSSALYSSADGTTLVATGGGDGKVILTEPVSLQQRSTEAQQLRKVPSRLSTTTLSSVLDTLGADYGLELQQQPHGKKAAKDNFRHFVFLSERTILASTATGRLLICSLSPSPKDGDQMTWSEVLLSDTDHAALRSCAVMRRFELRNSSCKSVALLGTSKGLLYMYRENRGLSCLATDVGSVVDVLKIHTVASSRRPPSSETSSELELLVAAVGKAEPSLLSLDVENATITTKTTIACLDQRCIVTSAAATATHLLLGSRSGSLHIIQRTDTYPLAASHQAAPENDAITAILPLSVHTQPGGDPAAACFITTSRDGKYRIFELSSSPSKPQLDLRHETAVPFGSNLEGALLLGTQLVVYGFRGTHFVVWNESAQREIARVECGGAHRTFALSLPNTANAGDYNEAGLLRIAFSRAASLNLYTQARAGWRILQTGSHGREVRAVDSVIATNSAQGAQRDRVYLATGAEDTIIRIWEQDGAATTSPVETDVKSLRCVAQLKRHAAGVKRLRWFGAEYLLSSGGNEEFYVWRLRQLHATYSPGEASKTQLAVLCEAVFPDRSADKDLRITDFDVCAEDSHCATMRISMAFSNSSLKTYRYSTASGFQLVARGAYTGACLTQVRELCSDPAADTPLLELLTASTDGYIALWQCSRDIDNETVQEFALAGSVQAHQSSIKSLDLVPLVERRVLVVTGGDDNALAVTVLERGTAGVMPRGTHVVRSAHAAAINGVAIQARDAADKAVYVVSASNDQRLKTWRVIVESGDGQNVRVKVALVEERESGVADAGDVNVLPDGEGVVVVGLGVEVWMPRGKLRPGDVIPGSTTAR